MVALGAGPAPALAGTAPLAVGQGFSVPALGLLALARIPPGAQGAAAGSFFAFFDAGVAAGGLAAGAVARATSPPGALVMAAGAVAAAGAMSVGLGARREPALRPAARAR